MSGLRHFMELISLISFALAAVSILYSLYKIFKKINPLFHVKVIGLAFVLTIIVVIVNILVR